MVRMSLPVTHAQSAPVVGDPVEKDKNTYGRPGNDVFPEDINSFSSISIYLWRKGDLCFGCHDT